MKQIVTIAFILLLSSGGWAQENEKEQLTQQQISTVNQIIETKIAEKQVEIQKEFIEEIRKQEDRSFNKMAIIIGSISILITLLLIFIDKWATSKAEGNIFNKLSKIANHDKVTFIKSLEAKAEEFFLKENYNLILVNNDSPAKLSDLQCMLKKFGFRNVLIRSIGDKLELAANDILMLFDTKKYEVPERNINLAATGKGEYFKSVFHETFKDDFFECNKNAGFFYINIYKGQFHFNGEIIDCFGFAKSNTTIYSNLMSLIYYKKYRDEIR